MSKYRRYLPGHKGTRLYNSWRGMRDRCYRESNSHYYLYGARGIKVCDEWRESFDAFADWAYANGYAEGLTIDRIDNHEGYYPFNCRWIPASEQSKNRLNTGNISYGGHHHMTVVDACKMAGITKSAVAQEVYREKCSRQKAFDAVLCRKLMG